MSTIEPRLYRMSYYQLRALNLIAQAKNGILSSTDSAARLGKRGKSLGGIFSSLSRQVVAGEHLILSWGRSPNGLGLRWKLNTKLIDPVRLREITAELIASFSESDEKKG